jgi:hypothetical protein
MPRAPSQTQPAKLVPPKCGLVHLLVYDAVMFCALQQVTFSMNAATGAHTTVNQAR